MKKLYIFVSIAVLLTTLILIYVLVINPIYKPVSDWNEYSIKLRKSCMYKKKSSTDLHDGSYVRELAINLDNVGYSQDINKLYAKRGSVEVSLFTSKDDDICVFVWSGEDKDSGEIIYRNKIGIAVKSKVSGFYKNHEGEIQL